MRLVSLLFIISFLSCTTAEKELQPTSQVIDSVFYSTELQDTIAYKVYLPEIYSDTMHFPIIYLMHGHGGDEENWFEKDGGNLQNVLDSLIAIKRIPPMIATTLGAGNSWYVDAIQNMESAYIEEFIPLIESTYSIKKERKSRIIAGLSAGGYGALRFSLKYPELFYASILLSPAAYEPEPPLNSSSRKIPVFQKDSVFSITLWQQYSYTKLVDTTKLIQYPKFYHSTGDDDEYNIIKVVTDLKTFFDQRSIANELIVIDGAHTWDVWRYCFTHDLIRIFDEADTLF